LQRSSHLNDTKKINAKNKVTLEAKRGIAEIEAFLADISKAEETVINSPHPAKIYLDEVSLVAA